MPKACDSIATLTERSGFQSVGNMMADSMIRLSQSDGTENSVTVAPSAVTTHILVIEDQLKLARFLEMELHYEGYQVSLRHDGVSGLAAIQACNPDLVILDWELPRLSGPEICRQSRSTGNLVPIILITAKDEAGDRQAGLEAGADDYLVKPFTMDDLLVKIRYHLKPESLKTSH
jgi:DNA-binding response OmpR family regulator